MDIEIIHHLCQLRQLRVLSVLNKINTFKHNHGSIDVQTYRINNFAYSTDFKNFYENDIDKLKDLDLWIVGLLRYDPHLLMQGLIKLMSI